MKNEKQSTSSLTKRQKAELEQYEADKKKWAEEDERIKAGQQEFLRKVYSILKG
jgi:hypothetical protein